MDWNEAMRRIGNGEPVQDVLDEKLMANREEFRSFLADMGPRGADQIARFDQEMRNLDSGVTGARGCWAALSKAQREVLIACSASRTPRMVRRVQSSTFVLCWGFQTCGLATLRNLCARDLMAWDGGAFDPEGAAVLTERGRFVVRHGPT